LLYILWQLLILPKGRSLTLQFISPNSTLSGHGAFGYQTNQRAALYATLENLADPR
jgi:hypothetical protein